MKLSTFARSKKFIPETLGNKDLPADEQFYFTISTLENTDAFELNAVMLRAKRADMEAEALDKIEQDGVQVLSPEAQILKQEAALAVIQGFGRVAVKYCEVHNLSDGEGHPITAQDLTKYPEFAETIVELMTFIMGISSPTEDDEKN